jgi:hypothetical protein
MRRSSRYIGASGALIDQADAATTNPDHRRKDYPKLMGATRSGARSAESDALRTGIPTQAGQRSDDCGQLLIAA